MSVRALRTPLLLAALAIALGSLRVPPTSAYTFEKYTLEIHPADDSAREIIRFTIYNDGDRTLRDGNYTIGTSIENLKVRDEDGLLQYSSTSFDGSTLISYDYRTPLEMGDSVTVEISFSASGMVGTSSFTDAEGIQHQDRLVSTGFTAPAKIEALKIVIMLEEGAWLARSMSDHDTITGSPVQPLDASIASNGTRLAVIWDRENVSQGERFDLYVAYNLPARRIKVHLPSVFLAAGLGAITGGLVIYYLLRRRTTQTQIQHTLALLEEGERRVLKIIMEKGGDLRQDELIELTGYSKARVSQLVTHLEKLGLIRKERFERTNRLFLTGEVREA